MQNQKLKNNTKERAFTSKEPQENLRLTRKSSKIKCERNFKNVAISSTAQINVVSDEKNGFLYQNVALDVRRLKTANSQRWKRH